MRAGANVDDLAGDVAGSFRSQKNHRVRDVVRVDQSPERSQRNVLGDHGLDVVQVAALVVEGSKYEARSNRIGSHADRTEFNGHLLGEPHDRRFRADLGRVTHAAQMSPRADIHNAARTLCTPEWHACLRHQHHALDIDVHRQIPQSAMVVSSRELLGSVPALFTKTSRRPNFSPMSRTSVATESWSVTST